MKIKCIDEYANMPSFDEFYGGIMRRKHNPYEGVIFPRRAGKTKIFEEEEDDNAFYNEECAPIEDYIGHTKQRLKGDTEMEEQPYFKRARVGDEVEDLVFGNGKIISTSNTREFPLRVEFVTHKGTYSYTHQGFREEQEVRQRLFYKGVKVIPPPTPKMKIKCDYSVVWCPDSKRIWDGKTFSNHEICQSYIDTYEGNPSIPDNAVPATLHVEYEVER